MAKRDKVKKGLDILLRGIATTAASAARPDTAASLWLKKMFSEGSENSIKKRIENEFVGKHVFMTLLSNPTQVVWGHVQRILWREHLDGDLIVKHPVHGYITPVSRDNVGLAHLFDNEDELRWYADEEFREGNIREGSFKMTFKGAFELGMVTLESLVEYVRERRDAAIFIPQDFTQVLESTRKDFLHPTTSPIDQIGLFPRTFEENTQLAQMYPFEYTVLHTLLNYAFNMARMAKLSELA